MRGVDRDGDAASAGGVAVACDAESGSRSHRYVVGKARVGYPVVVGGRAVALRKAVDVWRARAADNLGVRVVLHHDHEHVVEAGHSRCGRVHDRSCSDQQPAGEDRDRQQGLGGLLRRRARLDLTRPSRLLLRQPAAVRSRGSTAGSIGVWKLHRCPSRGCRVPRSPGGYTRRASAVKGASRVLGRPISGPV